MENVYAIGIVLGLCQVAKVAGLNTRWIPLLGVIIGITLSYIIPGVTVAMGIISALSAMGLYSGTKTTANVM